MIETNLSMNDFTRYFESNRLGKLYFPNGLCFDNAGRSTPFHIDLRNLYKLVTGWKVNATEVPLDDIVGIIAFGSAVRHPGYEEVSRTRKKYGFWGPEITKIRQVPIQPHDADFLVITGANLVREKVIETVSLKDSYGGTWIQEGGIHLVNRGIEQVVNGVQANDTVSASAMREGVPIFYNGRLGEVQSRAGIARESPRRILLDENELGYLVGKIE